MISRTFGAPLGGTTRGGHQGFESLALSLMTPPNFGGGGGSCLPSIVVVALGEPGVPVTCWAPAGKQAMTRSVAVDNASVVVFMVEKSCVTRARFAVPCIIGRHCDRRKYPESAAAQ